MSTPIEPGGGQTHTYKYRLNHAKFGQIKLILLEFGLKLANQKRIFFEVILNFSNHEGVKIEM